jgi:hypothetical protein
MAGMVGGMTEPEGRDAFGKRQTVPSGAQLCPNEASVRCVRNVGI